MKRLACLVALALPLPCSATGPLVLGPNDPFESEWVVSARLLRTILFPIPTYARQVADRIEYRKLRREAGRKPLPRGPYWPFLD